MVAPIKLGREFYVKNYQGLHVPLAAMSIKDLWRAWQATINRKARLHTGYEGVKSNGA